MGSFTCWLLTLAGIAAAEPMVVSVSLRGGPAANSWVVNHGRDIAEKILASAGVRLEWCRSAKRCKDWDNRLLVTLEPTAPRSLPKFALAYAKVFEGRTIRIFMDRFEEATATKVSLRGPLLGHVLAHEIIHLVQACDHHSKTGVMKAVFDANDHDVMFKRPLPLEPTDIDLIRQGWEKGRPSILARR